MTLYGPTTLADGIAWLLVAASFVWGASYLIADHLANRPPAQDGANGRDPRGNASRSRFRARTPFGGSGKSECARGDSCRCAIGAKCGPRVPLSPRAAPGSAR